MVLKDLNEEEKQKILEIEERYKPELKRIEQFSREAKTKFDAVFPKDKRKIPIEKTTFTDEEQEIIDSFYKLLEKYTKIATDYSNEKRALIKQIERKQLEYYSVNIAELIDDIKTNVEMFISYLFHFKNKCPHKEGLAVEIYNDNVKLQNEILKQFAPNLDILKEKATKDYHKMLKFIENAVKNKEGIVIRAEDEKKALPDRTFALLLQDNGMNTFNKIVQLKETRGDLQTFGGQITFKQDDVTINILDYEPITKDTKKITLKTSLKKLLDIAVIYFTNNGHNPMIKFPLNDYMKLCGLKDKKEARKQVNEALEMLYRISISYDDSKNKNKSRNYRDMRLCDEKGIKNGIVHLRFAGGFVEELEKMPIMSYPLCILETSKGRNNLNTFYIARKLSELKNMNTGKENEYIIYVETLVKICPYLPTEEDVQTLDRNYKARIVEPFISDFEEALNVLGIGENGYEWYTKDGKEIPFDKLLDMDYETFINAKIRLDEWTDYPRTELLENKEKKQNETMKKKRTRKTKNRTE